jgi:peroxiredoxin Q/BCP
MLNISSKAPNFTLTDANGEIVSLSDFLGKKVVLYFYPKDNTPGCTRQACAFASAYENFKSNDIVVIGISRD